MLEATPSAEAPPLPPSTWTSSAGGGGSASAPRDSSNCGGPLSDAALHPADTISVNRTRGATRPAPMDDPVLNNFLGDAGQRLALQGEGQDAAHDASPFSRRSSRRIVGVANPGSIAPTFWWS